MGRQVARLTVDNLQDLPAHAQTCLFWELGPVQRQQVRGREREEKAAWVSGLREWGSCGRVIYVDDRYAGHLMWAPASYLPGGAGFATAPVSEDAVLLATGHVAEEFRGGGLGRVLVQAMAKDLLRRGVPAVEAFGDTRDGGGEVLPVDFLLAVGFATRRPHVTYPRMRMDLHSTLTWRSEFGEALNKLRGVVRKRPAPVPQQRGEPVAGRAFTRRRRPSPTRRARHGAH